MPSKAHAVLGASSAERWMNCTPSAMFTKDMPDRKTEFSAEGDTAHAIAERMLNTYLTQTVTPCLYTEDELRIETEVKPYVDRCIQLYKDLKAEHKDAVMFVETKVNFENYVPKGFGTADCIIIAGSELHVRDLKFGKGVPVSAIDNPQARCYSLGALNMFGDFYPIKRVFNEIDQVRLDNGLSEEEMSVEELTSWGDKVLKTAAIKASVGEGEFKSGRWCRFCKGSVTCPLKKVELTPIITLSDKVDTPLSDEEMTKILLKKDSLVSWINSIEKNITERLEDGEQVEGWKLVHGRSNRKYSDELKIVERLNANGIDDALIYNKTLIGLTNMETVLGGKKRFNELLGDLIIKPEGKPTLVPYNDKRPAITNDAKDDFADVKTSKGDSEK